ncbi:crossover junction endodeoxyribonuclease RuvC [Patescibacteria group bacterium]
MKILGIDPGTARLGWGVLEYQNNEFKVWGYDCIQTHSNQTDAVRLYYISQELQRIIKKFKPQVIAIEELFFSKNIKTAISVAQARGVILSTACKYDLEIKEYKPTEVKQAITGVGNASKEQVQKMVQIVLNLKHAPKLDDTADALACAIAGASNN